MTPKAPVSKALVFVQVFIYFITAPGFLIYLVGPIRADLFYQTYTLLPKAFIDGAFWQPVTYMFLHYNSLHIIANMIGLWSLGQPIEMTIGSKRFFFLYMISGLISALFIILFQFDNAIGTLGASGCVFGLLGALAIFYPNSRLLVLFIPMKARTAAIIVAILSIYFAIFDILPFISHVGHLGGLLGGTFFIMITFILDQKKIAKAQSRGFRSSSIYPQEKWHPDFQRSTLEILFEKLNKSEREQNRFYNYQKDSTKKYPPEFADDISSDTDIPDSDNDKDKKIFRYEYQAPDDNGNVKEIFYNPETGKFEIRDK
jgi:membrane associated rhomboid family serine protease